ncbi:hypothetical protein F8606_25860, partial [Salmonella enterica]|nr:hypothetical protein [Salmonella enterica subsp. enterica serovar Benin]EBW4218717.1 hypothetical protein [Salmonella enterica subsp. enterica serovar Benin]ECE9227808.1 hypothetical protein [Salmonella enterica subsp. enterica serovar Benin]ECZ8128362.1 hypothetical protein [Salmonella enterica]EEG5324731.1 hypothetical protein [Salmonella enterica]
MAVENKFKLNFIAASVLMGLSLSAVASTATATNKETETTTVTKTLAEAVKAVNPAEVTFDPGKPQDNPSEKADLAGLLTYISPLDFSKPTDRANVTASVRYAHNLLLGTYSSAQEGEKAAA